MTNKTVRVTRYGNTVTVRLDLSRARQFVQRVRTAPSRRRWQKIAERLYMEDN